MEENEVVIDDDDDYEPRSCGSCQRDEDGELNQCASCYWDEAYDLAKTPEEKARVAACVKF